VCIVCPKKKKKDKESLSCTVPSYHGRMWNWREKKKHSISIAAWGKKMRNRGFSILRNNQILILRTLIKRECFCNLQANTSRLIGRDGFGIRSWSSFLLYSAAPPRSSTLNVLRSYSTGLLLSPAADL
jgi:hypothetical protein